MAGKMRPATWRKMMWDRVITAQWNEIRKKHGKETADRANYGWGDSTSAKQVSVATKVYGVGVLLTEVAFPSRQISHDWRDF